MSDRELDLLIRVYEYRNRKVKELWDIYQEIFSIPYPIIDDSTESSLVNIFRTKNSFNSLTKP